MEDRVAITRGPLETASIGEEIAKSLKKGTVLALYGELGSGKTTFVQGLARGLGIKRRIISPTFVIIRQYKLSPPGSPRLAVGQAFGHTFYHIDLYRIENEKEVGGLGLEEIISDPENIVAIEWAEKMKKFLPKKRIDIFFEHVDEQRRKITVEKGN